MFNFLNVQSKKKYDNEYDAKLGIASTMLLDSKNFDQSVLRTYCQGLSYGNVNFYENYGNLDAGCILWANITPKVLHRIKTTKLATFHPSEWNEGDICFVVHCLAPYGHFKFIMNAFLSDHPKICYLKKSIRYYPSQFRDIS